MLKRLLTALAGLTAFALGAPAQAANILVNGDFELISVNRTSIFGTDPTPPTWPNSPTSNQPQDGIVQTVTGWQTAGYNFVVLPGTADRPTPSMANANNPAFQQGASPFGFDFALWGSNNGGLDPIPLSPTGGNFIAADAAYRVAPIYQQLNNLVIGATYTLTFNWAAGQAYPFGSGGGPDTTEGWTACFGTCDFIYGGPEDTNPNDTRFINGEIYSTGTVTNPNMGFTPWMSETMTFTATSVSQKLSLLAYGTPLGQPPFSLIDSVSLDGPLLPPPAVPEPTTWMMLVLGFGLVGGAIRKRSNSPRNLRGLDNQIV